jgi:hypothetical protein
LGRFGVVARWVRARRLLLLLAKVEWRLVGRPFRGRWRCRGRRLWVVRAVVVFATEVESVIVVVIAAPTAAVIALGLVRAAVLEQAQ